MNSSGKLQYLNSVELVESFTPEVDHTRKKLMTTFPYPYMNGKLHLGHLYSLSKADFFTYFKKLEGYNVLFPFAFHCTGMPISASAYKLDQELKGKKVDVSVLSILKGLGIEDVKPFVDPLHWIRTFPKLCIESLKAYQGAIDWRRRFITTDINKYYDSFVQYQFRKLKRMGYLNFGKRYSIFCTIDQQACLDHDRRRGEGLKPVEVVLRKIFIDENILLIRGKTVEAIEKVVMSKDKIFVCFMRSGKPHFIEEELYENLKYQASDIEYVKTVTAAEIKDLGKLEVELIDKSISSKIVMRKDNPSIGSNKNASSKSEYDLIMNRKNEELKLVESENYIKMYEPEGEIISRSGSKCVVSLLDQWYIDYGNEGWKEKARLCLKKMTLSSETRAKLEDALEWINKWGFSRSFGLGTRIPWDKQYLIDSLSDSTIYNAFYTFKHFMFSDLEGKEEIFPSSLLCDEVFEYIFGDIQEIPEKLASVSTILKKSKESFEYFYPVDLRVSGKDLIGNHLIFFIFNHVALFDEKYWPKGIFTNGHLMLNSQKMSKSDGNYLTVEDALAKFGASATRMCLADCGDTNEDANFVEATANSMVLKLYTLTKVVESLNTDTNQIASVENMFNAFSLNDASVLNTQDKKNTDETTNKENIDLNSIKNMKIENSRESFISQMFMQAISKNIKLALQSHENMIYRDVLKYAFYENLRLIELYTALKGTNPGIVAYGYKTMLQLVYPIIPSLANYLLKLKFDSDLSVPKAYTSNLDKTRAIDHLKNICSRIVTLNKNYDSVEISVSRNYCQWKSECMKIVDGCSEKSEIIKKAQDVIQKHGLHKGKAMVFCMDYFAFKEKYHLDFDEYSLLLMFKDYIEENCRLKVEISVGDYSDPLNPDLKFK